MKYRARSIITLTLVATTLCAGRWFMSGPNDGPESRLPSERLVARITRGLSRTVGRNPIVVTQRRMSSPVAQPPVLVSVQGLHSTAGLSPFQFRLPPPLL
jgi:hypothetical protein